MQQFTYWLSLWIPYFGTAFNSVDSYVFWSQMTPAAGIGLEVARVESDSRQLKKLIGEWRSVAPLYYGDFYPLTPYNTEPTSWIAWQFGSTIPGSRFSRIVESSEMGSLASRLVWSSGSHKRPTHPQ